MIDLTKKYTAEEIKEFIKDVNSEWNDYYNNDKFKFRFERPRSFTSLEKDWTICNLCNMYEVKHEDKSSWVVTTMAYVIFEKDVPEYMVGIYEPRGYNINEKRGVITFSGYNEVITLYLDNGEID